jgi:ECF sigma factor
MFRTHEVTLLLTKWAKGNQQAFDELVDQTSPSWQNRAHFFGVAARPMRQILVDHARRRQAGKRAGNRIKVSH